MADYFKYYTTALTMTEISRTLDSRVIAASKENSKEHKTIKTFDLMLSNFLRTSQESGIRNQPR